MEPLLPLSTLLRMPLLSCCSRLIPLFRLICPLWLLRLGWLHLRVIVVLMGGLVIVGLWIVGSLVVMVSVGLLGVTGVVGWAGVVVGVDWVVVGLVVVMVCFSLSHMVFHLIFVPAIGIGDGLLLTLLFHRRLYY